MPQRLLVVLTLCVGATFAFPARADVIVTLSPFEAEGLPVQGGVAAGSQILVEVLLSVGFEDNPVQNVRAIRFDVAASDEAVVVDEFTWSFDSIRDSGLYRLSDELPTPTAEYTEATRVNERTLDLSAAPTRVAIIEIIVNRSGVLSVVGSDGGSASSARVMANFLAPVEFNGANNTLLGGSVAFFVDGDQAPGDGNDAGNGNDNSGDGADDEPPPSQDTDGDGVNDEEDAFPNDELETIDTDEDGIGDNADPDDDDDGVEDEADAFPLDQRETVDTDGDGVGDNSDMFPTDPDRSADPTNDGNLGPKVTGSLCGMGLIGTMCLNLGGISIFRLVRRRAQRLPYRRRLGIAEEAPAQEISRSFRPTIAT